MRTAILLCLAILPAFAADEPAYPTGTSTQKFAGLEYSLVLPSDYDASKKYALIVGLHGMNGKASNIAGIFAGLARHGFIVCAPQNSHPGWSQPGVDKTKKIVSHLVKTLSIDPNRLHGAAFSQGCGSLSSLVFDKKLHFISASWSMGGSSGGKPPPWAKKEMGVIALVGSEDWGRGAAEGTVKTLGKKVRQAECQIQQGIGHEYPGKLTNYHHYWLRVMDGWFEPGEVGFFDWTDDFAAAKQTMADEKRGGLIYVYSKKDAKNPEARRVQNEVLFDPMVRHFGRQAVVVKMDLDENPEIAKALAVDSTPALLVMKPGGELSLTQAGKKIKASTFAKELRKLAKDKKPPKVPGVFVHR